MKIITGLAVNYKQKKRDAISEQVATSDSLRVGQTIASLPRTRIRTALAARQLSDAGIKVHPGERVHYTITDAKAKDRSNRVKVAEVTTGPNYDVEVYVRMLRATGALGAARITGRLDL